MGSFDKILFWFTLITIFALGIQFGQTEEAATQSLWVFDIYLMLFTAFMTFVGIWRSIKTNVSPSIRIFNGFVTMASFAIFLKITFFYLGFNLLMPRGVMYAVLIILILIGVSRTLSQTLSTRIHPALVFVLSFAVLILFGSLLLMLPGATTKGISFVNALFTSTSAVTVTGLSVVDTQKDFTIFGKVVIIFLIQMGGLGVLTFSNLFSMLFAGGGSFRNQIAMSDFINSENLGSTQKLLYKIILFVLTIELIGAIIIYFSIVNVPLDQDKIFFAVFHSISAFCNAGFSTLSNGLFELDVRYNYLLHTTIAFLIIFGGLGYNISLNYLSYLKYYFLKFWNKINAIETATPIRRNIIKINTIIVVQTTIALLLVGWFSFFVLEYNNTLKEHDLMGKIAVSFFNSVTPRTAGFNNVDMAVLLNPTVLITIALMWVGASPGSTGGGIKTSTFAIALLNLKNHLLGRENLEFRRKEIPVSAIQRSSVIMILSLLAVGAAAVTMSVLEPKIDIIKLIFECFSAFSTVGLTMGITFQLNDSSKILLIIMMFLGRVSLLTFLIAFIRQVFTPKQIRYQYPKEDIFIN